MTTPSTITEAIRRRMPQLAGVDVDALEPLPRQTVETPQEARERLAIGEQNRRARYLKRRPSQYASASYDQLTPQQNPDAVRGFLDSGALNAVFGGRTGAGKNHAAFAIGNDAIERGTSVVAWEFADLMDALRPNEAHPDQPGVEWMAATEAGLLILNDVGRETTTDFVRERMHRLLTARETQRGLIVTTNLEPPQFAMRYGSQALDRLEERCLKLAFTGPSMRRSTWS